ncbi:MAG: YbhB/YbcL family Raf kinase inhibitor-like protein [Elusimicrobia bacterium]|nr:YbhB/YbcL family Raf kinase inhibitor-like protein [Elusimicrobiota bacterium]
MQIKSTAFGYGERIPSRYTADGKDVSPPLEIDGVPEGTRSLVLISDDPDAYGVWDHWILFNIPADTRVIPEDVQNMGVQGTNSWGGLNYGGPAPPSGTHRYFFRLYALELELELEEGASRGDIIREIDGHVLDKAETMGTYARQ